MSERALDMMWALRIEDGRMWGESATDWQKEDAAAVLLGEDPDPTWHFLTRARGGSKTTDVGGMALSWLTMDALPLANGHIVAASTDQAAILIDAIAGIVARTPELTEAVNVESKRVIAPNGAWVEVLAQSDSGAWGLRDAHFLICDEFCQWPETRGAKRVWTAILTTAPKVKNCRLVVISSAGEPSHWSRKVFEDCQVDDLWHVHEVPGPVPWMSEAKLAGLERTLLPSEYDRLVLNIWSESEDRAIAPEDYEAAQQPCRKNGIAPAGVKGGGHRLRDPEQSTKYIVTVDVGVKNDATVICVAHKEPLTDLGPRGPQRVVVDHLDRWQGSKKHHVPIDAVRERVAALSKEYNRAFVHADPNQFIGTLQDLNKLGVRAKEWTFTATSVGTLATALVQTFRNGQIQVPHSAILKDELLSVKLRESAPGVTRLDHDRGGHDDQAVTIGLACHLLLDGSGGIGANFREFMTRDSAARKERLAEHGEDFEPKTRMERQMRSRRERLRADRKREQKTCLHRWNPDRSRCLFCGKVNEMEEVG